jgi:hypothetical protein
MYFTIMLAKALLGSSILSLSTPLLSIRQAQENATPAHGDSPVQCQSALQVGKAASAFHELNDFV